MCSSFNILIYLIKLHICISPKGYIIFIDIYIYIYKVIYTYICIKLSHLVSMSNLILKHIK